MKKNEQKDTAPGAPIAWEKPSQPEDVQPGYGFIPDNESEETFYYHSDHLGSTSYITDDSAHVTQYTAYLPYGELLVDEHTSSEEMPYKFNGKELDEETGLYYYGARYMQPVASIWYGIDPLTEKYPDVSAYTYCMGNPVKLVDVDGRKVYVFATRLPSSKAVFQKSGATHTFTVVRKSDGSIYRYSYGPVFDAPIFSFSGTAPIIKRNYDQDRKAVVNYFNNIDDINIKIVIPVNVPEGKNDDEFDDAVIRSAEQFKGNTTVKYRIIPLGETEGNCNSSTTSLLKNSGVDDKEIERIKSEIPGFDTGFGSVIPWTKEQRDAVEIRQQEKRKRDESLSNQIGF